MKKAVLKIKIKSREELERRMKEIDLEFDPIIWQHDRVYLPRGFKHGINLPRMIMRTEMKSVDKPAKYILILKRHIEDSGIDIVNQTVVKDYAEAVNMIYQLGFESKIEVSRRRQAMPIGENTFLYLDKVDNVPGYYLKLETAIADGDKVSEVMADLERTMRVFVEDYKSKIESPYFDML